MEMVDDGDGECWTVHNVILYAKACSTVSKQN